MFVRRETCAAEWHRREENLEWKNKSQHEEKLHIISYNDINFYFNCVIKNSAGNIKINLDTSTPFSSHHSSSKRKIIKFEWSFVLSSPQSDSTRRELEKNLRSTKIKEQDIKLMNSYIIQNYSFLSFVLYSLFGWNRLEAARGKTCDYMKFMENNRHSHEISFCGWPHHDLSHHIHTF